jgi:hypothetical protein
MQAVGRVRDFDTVYVTGGRKITTHSDSVPAHTHPQVLLHYLEGRRQVLRHHLCPLDRYKADSLNMRCPTHVSPRGVASESPLESPEIHFLVVLHTVQRPTTRYMFGRGRREGSCREAVKGCQ